MQALPISNEPSQFAAPPLVHASTQAALANTTDSSGPPAFAAVVREALGRTGGDAGNPPGRSSRIDSSLGAKKSPPSTNANTPAASPLPLAVSAALVIPISPLPVSPALPPSFESSIPPGASQNIPAGTTHDSATNDASRNFFDLQVAANFNVSLPQPPLASLQAAAAPPPPPLSSTSPSLPLFSAAAADSASGFTSATVPPPQTHASSVTADPENPVTDLPSLGEYLPSLQTLPLPDQTPPKIADGPSPTPPAQIQGKSPVPAHEDALPSLLPQVSPLPQPAQTAPLPPSALALQAAPSPSHLEVAQAAAKASLTSVELFTAHSATNASPATTSKPVLSESKELLRPAIASAPASPDAAQSDSRDASSGAGTQNKPDSSTHDDASAPTARETPAFAQILSTTATIGADTSQTTSTPLVLASAAPSNDRGTAANTPAPLASALPAPAPQSPFHTPDGVASQFVNSAKLVESATNSEMRVSMQTDNLGTVELRARVAGDQVGAAIMVEKRDAHSALAIELPALQQALSDKQLRVEQVFLFHGSFSSTAGGSGSPAQQGQRGLHSAPQAVWSAGAVSMPFFGASSEQSGIFDSQGRLSVRA